VKFCRLQDVIAKDVNLVAETVMKKVAAEAIEENYSGDEILWPLMVPGNPHSTML
jgi:hypothetical protein